MHNVIFSKTVTKVVTILAKYFFPNLNPTSYFNNKHLKITVNSKIQFFENQKKDCESLNIFAPLTTKWRSCKIFAKLNGNHLLMANAFKLHEYHTFSLMKMYNMNKIWFTDNKFSFWKSLVYNKWAVENATLWFLNFSFFQILNESSFEVLLRRKNFWSTHFWNWNNKRFKFFGICTEMQFLSFTFSK